MGGRNQFGVYLTKERLTEENIEESINEVVKSQDIFVENMKTATEIATNDPGAGASAMKFYADLLIKEGNADFLTNKMIKKQSYFEVNNTDFILITFFVSLLVFCIISVCVWKCLKRCCKRFVYAKHKEE